MHAVGVEAALRALEAAAAAAFAAAGLPVQTVTAACLGLAGADRSWERSVLEDWARRVRLCEHLELTSDAALLLAAGTPENWGLALVAGTGSIAVGRAEDGRMARAGGWGYLLGDEGSGYRIALAALQAVARAADGRGPATALTESFLGHLKLDAPQALIQTVYRSYWDRARLAGLAPLVFAASEAGDAVARQVVSEAAEQLAQTGAAVLRQLGWQGPVPLALAGGCLQGSTSYRDEVVRQLRTTGLAFDPIMPVSEPAVGAVRLASAAFLA